MDPPAELSPLVDELINLEPMILMDLPESIAPPPEFLPLAEEFVKLEFITLTIPTLLLMAPPPEFTPLVEELVKLESALFLQKLYCLKIFLKYSF